MTGLKRPERDVAVARDGELDRADPGDEGPLAGAVVGVGPLLRLLVGLGAQLLGGLCRQDRVEKLLQEEPKRISLWNPRGPALSCRFRG